MTGSFSLLLRRSLVCVLFATSLTGARGQSDASDISAASAVPIAASLAVLALVLSGAAEFSIVATEAVGNGAGWVLERASDGARATVHLSGRAAGATLLVVGGSVTVTAIGAGWVLSTAGQVIAFIPNQIGAALLHNERVTR